MSAPVMTIADLAPRAQDVLEELELAIVGKRDVLSLVLTGLLANGHILIEDYPGLGKTLIARSLADVLGLSFGRVQFTPDLMPSDITGSSIYDQRSGEFEFRAGPVFANLLLGDEINRAPPKTQAALLEAMQERQVTADGATHRLEQPFLVLATQNPIEWEGTYPLPEAQLDRFTLRVALGYPNRDEEWELLSRRVDRRADEVQLETKMDRQTFVAMQAAVEEVHAGEAVGRYVVELVSATRADARVAVGASPRGALALLRAARARAAMAARDFVVPEDVKAMAIPALAHRLVLRPELWLDQVGGGEIVRDCLGRVPAPVSDDEEGG